MGHRIKGLGKIKVDNICLQPFVIIQSPIIKAFQQLCNTRALSLKPMLMTRDCAIIHESLINTLIEKALKKFDDLAC